MGSVNVGDDVIAVGVCVYTVRQSDLWCGDERTVPGPSDGHAK